MSVRYNPTVLNIKHGVIVKQEIIVAEVSQNGKFVEETNWESAHPNQSTVSFLLK